MNDKARTHLHTAELLLKGIAESDQEQIYNKWCRYNCPPEHSYESMKRRLVQIRQELLIVLKELDK